MGYTDSESEEKAKAHSTEPTPTREQKEAIDTLQTTPRSSVRNVEKESESGPIPGEVIHPSTGKGKNTASIVPSITILPGEAVSTTARLASERAKQTSFVVDVPQMEDIPAIAELAYMAYEKKYNHSGLTYENSVRVLATALQAEPRALRMMAILRSEDGVPIAVAKLSTTDDKRAQTSNMRGCRLIGCNLWCRLSCAFLPQESPIEDDFAHLDYIAVHPKFRKRGYGRKLISWAMQKSERLGKLFLSLHVSPENEAKMFFSKVYFRVVDATDNSCLCCYKSMLGVRGVERMERMTGRVNLRRPQVVNNAP
eukprot:CAMPEP_0113880422 /NCGR_PEP_ID=MMETSP0780_2-20120614/7777_1 /TAXON_ID=652834 /ORGANISM="Palpitomonas bilix" /LENGTH=310 /DNA_ID=CAMNT_0000867097 /DNA_START=99 /DNA_END=1031 /DNA_ORIENTATION=- /assembly_acc=CAM_ASM_000599